MIGLIVVIIIGALVIWAYQTPEGKKYKKSYIQKFGYWDTAMCVGLMLVYNLWAYSAMGVAGLIFPITLFFDVIFLCAIISSVIRVRRSKK